MNSQVYGHMEWALTEHYQLMLNGLVATGLDKDVAFAMIESWFGEEEIYDIPVVQDENKWTE